MAFRFFFVGKTSSWMFTSKEAENFKCSVRWTRSQWENNMWVTPAQDAHEAGFLFPISHIPEEQSLVSSKGKNFFFF